MASAKYYIEKRKTASGGIRTEKVPIYLFFSFNGKRFQFYTGERIDSKYWDDKKQRIKPNYPGAFEINAILEHLSEKAYRFYRERRLAGVVPTVEDFKTEFAGTPSQSNPKSLFDFYQEYIESKKIGGNLNSIKKYQTNLTHLKEFAITRHFKVEFDSINDAFFDKYLNFFIYDLEHTNNTISRNIRILKTFLNWATKRGYNTKMDFKNFSFKGFDGEIIYLTMDELKHLSGLAISNEKLSKVRDIFCFGCYTGLRYSDIQNLKKEDIRGDFIRSISIKTRDQLCIPLNEYSKALIQKYAHYPIDFCFPAPSNQKMNDYLKELGQLAGFSEEINLVQFRGAKRIEIKYFKYQLLTTHVARKTFVTNAHQQGVPTETIMKITNHKNHQTVARYLKIEEQQMLEAMRKIF